MAKSRDSWASRLGVILAVAGSAVGLGNFLRFPVQAVQNGGGAFMIPYFISLLLLGIPLMWVEWTLGRYGGGFGHGTAPGIFHSIWRKNRFIKYFGVIGIFGPLAIFVYYTYIESWTLGFGVLGLMGKMKTAALHKDTMQAFLSNYQTNLWPSYLFFLLTFFANMYVIFHGVSKGIERFSRWAMPTLLIMALVLMVRVLTLGAPYPDHPDWNVLNGLGYLWNPDFSALLDPKVWLAAAGQIFFTLSVGIGVILTYASYLKKTHDVVLSGLTSVSTNEFIEVVIAGSIVIPAAFAFLGPVEIEGVAKSGAFNLGFVTMPMILNRFPWPQFFTGLWFLLLFLAGVTSSVSLVQPAIAFLEDEFNISRRKAVAIFAVVSFILTQPVVFWFSRGIVDEMDFWAGTVALVVFALIEVVLFTWVFGMDNAWEEIHQGADLRVPRVYKFIMKYITPTLLLVILVSWLVQSKDIIFMTKVSPENKPFVLGTRLALLGSLLFLAVLVNIAWRRREALAKAEQSKEEKIDEN